MAVDESLADEFARRKAVADARRGSEGTSGVGGGDEPPHYPRMEARVAKLEDTLQGIGITLATMTEQLKHVATKADMEQLRAEIQAVRTDSAVLSGKLDGKASAVDLGRLDSRVGRIPTVPVLVGLLALVSTFLAAWPWIRLNVFHLTG